MLTGSLATRCSMGCESASTVTTITSSRGIVGSLHQARGVACFFASAGVRSGAVRFCSGGAEQVGDGLVWVTNNPLPAARLGRAERALARHQVTHLVTSAGGKPQLGERRRRDAPEVEQEGARGTVVRQEEAGRGTAPACEPYDAV